MKEIRIGLVLYGGVSLAVYINGVTTELWNLLRASRARQNGSERDKLDNTAKIYAELLDRLECLTGNDFRVVVDTIAGSSAGGINGATLAKAIVDGGDARVVSDLWIEDADISGLRAEPKAKLSCLLYSCLTFGALLRWPAILKVWVSNTLCIPWKWFLDHLYTMIVKPKGRSTPFKGEYFTRMLVRTFAKMGENEEKHDDGKPVQDKEIPKNGKTDGDDKNREKRALLPDRGSFDLYITQTDIYGWPRHLPVTKEFHRHKPLYERTHAHVMHFRSKPCGGKLNDDFGLIYAARGTASFPLAFPPINYQDVSKDICEARKKEDLDIVISKAKKFTCDHLQEHRLFCLPTNRVWMMDGGVLDNKPFSYVTQAIEGKAAEHEVYRAVVYVEPNPKGEVKRKGDGDAPTSLRVGSELPNLLLHEPVYEDLRRLRDRNAKVKKIKNLLGAHREHGALQAAKDVSRQCRCLGWPPDPANADRWKQATNSFAAKASLSGYQGYVVLKVRSSTRMLGNVICRALHYPRESRHGFFIRQLVREWFKNKGALEPPSYCNTRGYVLNQAQRSLLRNFDVPFRLRRLRALAHATNEIYRDFNSGGGKPSPKIKREDLDKFKSNLEEMISAFQLLEEDEDETRKGVIQDLFSDQKMDSDIRRQIKDNNFKMGEIIDKHEESLEKLCETLSKHFRSVSNKQEEKMVRALRCLPYDGHKGIRQRIMEAFVTFPFVDLIGFPLMDAADIEDLVDVKVMRISPFDVPRNNKPPLKSRGLGSFKGFFCKPAREHDLKWGRLDGAQRLIDLVIEAVGAEDQEEIYSRYLKQLTRAIDENCFCI